MALSNGYAPRPDHAKLRALDLSRVVISYDRVSDTLMIHLYGRGRPAVSVPSPKPLARDFVFLRFDPESDELVGIQIEDFLRVYVVDHPRAIDLLDQADLRGITHEEIARIRLRIGADERLQSAATRSLIEELALASRSA